MFIDAVLDTTHYRDILSRCFVFLPCIFRFWLPASNIKMLSTFSFLDDESALGWIYFRGQLPPKNCDSVGLPMSTHAQHPHAAPMVGLIEKLWRGSSEPVAVFQTGSCQNRISMLGNTGQASWIQRTLPKSLCIFCL